MTPEVKEAIEYFKDRKLMKFHTEFEASGNGQLLANEVERLEKENEELKAKIELHNQHCVDKYETRGSD